MKKTGFWSRDWFFAVLIVIVVLALSYRGIFEGLDTKAYDWGVTATSKPPSDKVAVIAIDDASINNIGRWPWSRDVHAKMIDKLGEAKAKVIGSTIFFFEPQQDPGLLYVSKMLEIYNKAGGVTPTVDGTPATPATAPAANAELAQIGALLNEAEQVLNTDRALAASIKKAGNVLLPSYFESNFSQPVGKPDQAPPAYAAKDAA